jgi:PAS domain S-box-containing protein
MPVSPSVDVPDEIAALREADDAVVVVDPAGTIVAMSAAAEELFGIDESDIAGEAIELLLPSEDRFGHQAHRRGYLIDPADREMDPRLEPRAEKPLDGEQIPVSVRLVPHEIGGATYVAAHVSRRG